MLPFSLGNAHANISICSMRSINSILLLLLVVVVVVVYEL